MWWFSKTLSRRTSKVLISHTSTITCRDLLFYAALCIILCHILHYPLLYPVTDYFANVMKIKKHNQALKLKQKNQQQLCTLHQKGNSADKSGKPRAFYSTLQAFISVTNMTCTSDNRTNQVRRNLRKSLSLPSQSGLSYDVR